MIRYLSLPYALFLCFLRIYSGALPLLITSASIIISVISFLSGISYIKSSRFSSIIRTQPAGTCFSFNRFLGNCLQRIIGYGQFYVFHFKQGLVLLEKRIFRFGQNFYQSLFVKVIQCGNNRQTADKLGNQSIFQQIFGLNLFINFAKRFFLCIFYLRPKTDRSFLPATADNLFPSGKSAAAYKQDICRINVQEFLLRMFSPPCGGILATVPSIIFSNAC